jgi:hypothetical protein
VDAVRLIVAFAAAPAESSRADKSTTRASRQRAYARQAMPIDDYSSRKPRERNKVELDSSPEVVRYWTTVLGCTEAELRAAVDAVGPNADDVRKHLGK